MKTLSLISLIKSNQHGRQLLASTVIQHQCGFTHSKQKLFQRVLQQLFQPVLQSARVQQLNDYKQYDYVTQMTLNVLSSGNM